MKTALGRQLACAGRLARETLGPTGIALGLFGALCVLFGLAILADESERLRRSGRDAMRPVIAGWVRSVSVDYLGHTLADYADRCRTSGPGDRPARLKELQTALEVLAARFDPLLELVSLEIRAGATDRLASWPVGPARAAPSADLEDRLELLPGSGAWPPILAGIRYRLSPEVARGIAALEVSRRRLVLALLVLSAFPVLSLISLALQAGALRERAAREAAQAATLELADRACHELGNVAFVLSNEQRNLQAHLDLVDSLLDGLPSALVTSARRLGLTEAQQHELSRVFERQLREQGLDPRGELPASSVLARSVLRQIGICSRYIGGMVRELDSYIKDTSQPSAPQAIHLADCVNDVLGLLQPRLDSAGIEVVRPAGGDATLVRADRRLLFHVLLNLIKNAEEAIRESGRAGRIVIAIQEEGGQARLSVSDNGGGIPGDSRASVFEIAVSTKGPGRGRGLAIARETVRTLGGELELETTSPQGTRFMIRLPLAGPTTNG